MRVDDAELREARAPVVCEQALVRGQAVEPEEVAAGRAYARRALAEQRATETPSGEGPIHDELAHVAGIARAVAPPGRCRPVEHEATHETAGQSCQMEIPTPGVPGERRALEREGARPPLVDSALCQPRGRVLEERDAAVEVGGPASRTSSPSVSDIFTP